MTIWLLFTFFTILGMVIFRKRKPNEENLEPPSNLVIFFNPIEGEGDVFLGGLLVLFFASRFFFRTISNTKIYFLKKLNLSYDKTFSSIYTYYLSR